MLSINSGSPVPVYEQLKRQIRLAIVSGRYPGGHRMPSIRELARRLTINPNTIAKVYGQLETEGFLSSKAGSGFFVEYPAETLERTRMELLDELAGEYIAGAVELGASPETVIELVRLKLEGKDPDDQT